MERRVARAGEDYAPRYVVWELTLKCDLACRHCGSRAGLPRQAELTLDEAKGVVAQLAEMGAREVTFVRAHRTPSAGRCDPRLAASCVAVQETGDDRAGDTSVGREALDGDGPFGPG